MKTFTVTVANYKKVQAIHKEFTREREELTKELFSAKRSFDVTEIKKQHDELDRVGRAEKEARLVLQVWKHNLYVAFWDEYFPKIRAIWDKYSGKKYGEKTAEKIRNEMKTELGIYVYANHGYSGNTNMSIDFGGLVTENYYCCNEYQIELSQYENMDSTEFLARDNTIQALRVDKIPYEARTYIDDPLDYVLSMELEFKELEFKAEKLIAKSKEFNQKLVSGFKTIDYTKFHMPIEIETERI